jgi:hypothetical protein
MRNEVPAGVNAILQFCNCLFLLVSALAIDYSVVRKFKSFADFYNPLKYFTYNPFHKPDKTQT